MNPDLLEGFYLNNLRVEPRKGKITGRLRSLRLAPRAMDVLVCLAHHPGEVVSRETLITEAWGEGGSSEALSHAVTQIRNTLDDRKDHPEYIETLPRQGYRLLVRPAASPESGDEHPSTGGLQLSIHETGLLENLKQRGVLETGLAYLVFGWLILQVADILFDQLHVPAWAGTFVTVGVIAGFPIALVLSWFLEFRHGRAVLHEHSPQAAARRRISRTYISVLAALAIAAVAVFFYDRNYGLPVPPAEAPAPAAAVERVLPPVLDNSIAVLPFLNLDGSGETEIFAQGLVDDVLGRLARVPGLLVSSRGDAFTLEPNSASSKVRERLRVARYVEGSVQIRGDRLRVIVQLIDSDTGFHLLSRTFDRLREDFFDIRDEITELTVANVRVALPADTQAEATISPSDPSLDAYVRYRQGVDASRLPPSADTIELALARFDEALSIDADYAAAHAGKCLVYVDAYPISDDPAFIDRAETSCAQALSLNPNLDMVHTALGELYLGTGRYEDAEDAYEKALQTNPNSVASLTGLGEIYRLQKRGEEAEERFRQAVGLHPGDWSAYNNLGYFLYRSGRYAEAAEQYELVVGLNDQNMVGFTNLGTAYMLAGDFESAAPAFRQAIDIEPRPSAYSNLGLMHYYLGDLDAAIDAHRQAVMLAPNDHLSWSNLGDALWIAGRREQAQEAFGKAADLARSALEVNPNDPGYLMDLAWIETMLGQPEEARRRIDRARTLAPGDPYVHYIDGLMRVKAGQVDEALGALEKAAEQGYSIQMLAADPQLAALRAQPLFVKIIDAGNTR
ncbi:MAG: tetratricopeptide repeat protein [Gammaproteobacteria bacterium]|nr:tetratricopeptide repeat protein [Gammaproteobacteria bacterium]